MPAAKRLSGPNRFTQKHPTSERSVREIMDKQVVAA